MDACTIVARNYLAQASLLADTFVTHHPGARVTVLVIDAGDEPVESDDPRIRVIGLEEAGFDAREAARMATIYSVIELATAVKPTLLRTLLRETGRPVAYFDPDIAIYRPLDDIGERAREHGIVLTPHTMRPLPRDGRSPEEPAFLVAGVYNLGFVAVGPGAEPFLDWWRVRLARDCLVATEHGLFVDQKWVDLAPAYWDHHVLRDPGCNVAYWNLPTRRFAHGRDGYTVDGGPLRFFHFSGYDPAAPHLLSKFQGADPRVRLWEHPALRRVCDEYGADLLERGHAELRALPYGFAATPGGLGLDPGLRRLYREALVTAEASGDSEPPNPFADGDEAFVAWLNGPNARSAAGGLTRYTASVWAGDVRLRVAFPAVPGADEGRFLDWLAGEGATMLGVPSALVPARAAAVPVPPVSARGVNVVGYFRAELGVGEAARRVLAGIAAAGEPHSTISYDRTLSRQEHRFEDTGRASARHDVNVVCINADQTPAFFRTEGAGLRDGRHTVGVWWWELDRFPPGMLEALDHVDEVWVGSEHIAGGLRAVTDVPVHTFPLPVAAERQAPAPRAALGLPDGPLFLFAFDHLSVVERKNPAAVIDAFRAAFAPGEGPVLVLKSINAERDEAGAAALRRRAGDRPDIVFVERYLTAEENRGLMAACDCYVSLHRSEGFGLTIAEAMAQGKPVIATGYSGNTTYMREGNSLPVPFRLVEVPPGCPPYPAGALWADPDVAAAAALMRRVVADPAEAAALGRRARADILLAHGPEAMARFVTGRLAEIRRGRDLPVVEAERALAEVAATAAPEAPAAPRRRGAGALAERVALRAPWNDAIALPGGLVTPGVRTEHDIAAEMGLHRTAGLAGRSVAVVGARDGAVAFACERLGARRVLALDDLHWQHRLANFRLAHAALGSSVEHRALPLARIHPREIGVWDVVLLSEDLFRADDPAGLLRAIGLVCRDACVLITFAAHWPAAPEAPVAAYCAGDGVAGDASIRWALSRGAVLGMLRDAGFRRAEVLAESYGIDCAELGAGARGGRLAIRAHK